MSEANWRLALVSWTGRPEQTSRDVNWRSRVDVVDVLLATARTERIRADVVDVVTVCGRRDMSRADVVDVVAWSQNWAGSQLRRGRPVL